MVPLSPLRVAPRARPTISAPPVHAVRGLSFRMASIASVIRNLRSQSREQNQARPESLGATPQAYQALRRSVDRQRRGTGALLRPRARRGLRLRSWLHHLFRNIQAALVGQAQENPSDRRHLIGIHPGGHSLRRDAQDRGELALRELQARQGHSKFTCVHSANIRETNSPFN